jgi:CheY-like chemotaxis protein
VATLRGEDTRTVPILVVSGSGPDAEPELARAADAWLIEPVSGERIVETLALVLQGHHREGVVLLVEDDEQLAQVIATLLADEGLRVVRSTSAAEAIERRQEQRPDVIVLDVRLPDGNGSDVVSAFHQRWPLAHTPIVVYSAAEVDPGRRAGLRLGTTVFLTKGQTTPEQLRDQVLALVPPTPTDPGATRQGKVDGVYSH